MDHISDRRVVVTADANNNGNSGSTKTNNSSVYGSDYKEFYDDFGDKTTGMFVDGRVEYLCVFRREGVVVCGEEKGVELSGEREDTKKRVLESPMWLSRADLEDQGYLADVKAYEERRKKSSSTPEGNITATSTGANTNTKVAPAKAVKSGPRNTKTTPHPSTGVTETFFAETAPLEDLCGFSIETVSNQFAGRRMTISSYASCISEKQLSAFAQCVQRNRKTHTPAVLYYTVKTSEMPEICRGGLKIPESLSDARKQHGFLHHIGLYAFQDPILYASYCTTPLPPPPTSTPKTIHQKQPKKQQVASKQHQQQQQRPEVKRILMCIGLLPNDGGEYDEDVTIVPDCCVIFNNSEFIVPVWAVDFFERREPCVTRRTVFDSYEALDHNNTVVK